MDGAFPAAHTAKLVRLRAYIVTCTECQKATDDVFAAKLSAYRKEYAEALTRARIAQAALDAATSGSAGSIFGVELVRG
jgi:hypothetical protein